jgi:hypothetical protein
MNIDYDWRFSSPGDKLNVYMKNIQSDAKMFDATLTLERQALTGTALNLTLLKYPLMTIKVVVAIYWQALQLWMKRIPFHPHPAPIK